MTSILQMRADDDRRLPNWLDAFGEYTEVLPSPPIFAKWSGIAAVAGAIERKLWVTPFGPPLYPNMYTVLVGPPGIGKTVITSQVQQLWLGLKDYYVAPSSVTAASLIDTLNDSKRFLLRPGEVPPHVEYHSTLVVSNELGVFIPGYENELMNSLTDIYDGHQFSQRRRGKDLKIKIERPQINFLAATTPAYLTSVMPQGAWDQGFLSRTMLIYSGEQIIRPLFTETTISRERYEDLAHDLGHISRLYGKCSFTEAAAARITEWHLAGGPPRPNHPRLLNYNARRTTHLLKLCMIASAACRDDRVIDVPQYEAALDWLIEAELFMPDIFKAMASGGDKKAIEDTWHFAYQAYMKGGKPIPQHRLIAFLSERIPSHSVARVLDVMVSSRVLEEQLDNSGRKGYVPRTKTLDE